MSIYIENYHEENVHNDSLWAINIFNTFSYNEHVFIFLYSANSKPLFAS